MSRSALICQAQFFRLSLPVDHIFDFERGLLVSLGKSPSLQTWSCFLVPAMEWWVLRSHRVK